MAVEAYLIPRNIERTKWRILVQELLEDKDIYHHVDRRFFYGKLRLSRLNKIYRLTQFTILCGDQNIYNRYSDFFAHNFT